MTACRKSLFVCDTAAAGLPRGNAYSRSSKERKTTMRRHRYVLFTVLFFASMFCFAQPGQAPKDSGHAMVIPGQTQWQPAAPPLPAGAQVAVLDGDPSQTG